MSGRSVFFNTHAGFDRPMALDADGCAEIDPVVEPHSPDKRPSAAGECNRVRRDVGGPSGIRE